MRAYLLICKLNESGESPSRLERLINVLEEIDQQRISFQNTTWLLCSHHKAEELKGKLGTVVGEAGELLIVSLGRGVWREFNVPPDTKSWLKLHVEGVGDVVSFERELYQLAIASEAFKEAYDVLKLMHSLQSQGLSDGERLYHGLITGLVVSYCRPFKQSSGVGRIGKEFGEFDEPFLKRTHDHLMNARDQVLAHFDVTSISKISKVDGAVRSPPRNPNYGKSIGVEIDCATDPQGNIHPFARSIRLDCITLNPQILTQVGHLLIFQMQRVESNLLLLSCDLYKAAGKKSGVFDFYLDGTVEEGSEPRAV